MTHAFSRRELLLSAPAGLCFCAAAAEPPSCCRTPALATGTVEIAGSTVTIDLARAPSLAGAGGSAMITDQQRKIHILVFRPEKRRYVALSSRCTHGGAGLTYNHRKRFVQCTSFGHSIFRLDGTVDKGPARAALKSYATAVSAGKLQIYL